MITHLSVFAKHSDGLMLCETIHIDNSALITFGHT